MLIRETASLIHKTTLLILISDVVLFFLSRK